MGGHNDNMNCHKTLSVPISEGNTMDVTDSDQHERIFITKTTLKRKFIDNNINSNKQIKNTSKVTNDFILKDKKSKEFISDYFLSNSSSREYSSLSTSMSFF